MPDFATAEAVNVSHCANVMLPQHSLCSDMLCGLYDQCKRGSCSPSVQQHAVVSAWYTHGFETVLGNLYLKEQGPLHCFWVILLGDLVTRAPNLNSLLCGSTSVWLRQSRLFCCFPCSTLGQVLLMPFSLYSLNAAGQAYANAW